MEHKNNAAYRRGVLLGLTMAEIIMLVVFILLIAFATMLDREKKHSEALERMGGVHSKAVDRIVAAISSEPPDLQEDIVRAVEKMPKVISLIKAKEITDDDKEAVDKVIERSIQTLKVQKSLQKSDGSKSIEQQLAEAVATNADLKQEAADLANQKSNLMSQMKAGFDWPPCWPDSNGRPSEYIFDIDLTDDGIVIKDSAPAHRASDKAKLPLSAILYGKVRSIGQFTAETAPLYNASRAKECHFYVALNDRTGNDKTIYKRQKTAVEGHFYKMERASPPARKLPIKEVMPELEEIPDLKEPAPKPAPKEEKSFLDSIF